VPHRLRLAAASLLEKTGAHLSLLAAARLLATPHRLLLAATSLLAASLLLLPPKCTWVARLQAVTRELVLRLQTLQPVEVDAQVIEA
jgi:hypothetical protein